MSFELLNPSKIVFDLLSDLQPGENPWPSIRRVLWISYVPDVSPSCEYQLYVISVLLGICLMFVALSLGVRVHTRTFWVARFGGWTSLWRPHWSISWSLWALVLCGLLQGQLWASVRYIKRESIVHGYIAWRLFVWMAAWFGGWTATWSLAVSFIAHLEANGRLAVSSRMTVFLNSLAFLVPLVYAACLLPFAIIASKRYDSLMKTFQIILDEIDSLDANFDGSFSLVDMADKMPLVAQMQRATLDMLRPLRQTFIVLAASGIFLLLTLVPVAILHIRSLHRVLRDSTTMSATLQSSGSQETALTRSYNNLKWTAISFSCIDACFTAICLHSALDTYGALTQSLPMELEVLAPLWIFAAFGVPTSILLFCRSLDSLSPGGVQAYKMRHSATATTSVDLGGHAISSSSSSGRRDRMGIATPAGFDMVPLSRELYELGRRPAGVGQDGEKKDKETSWPDAPAAAAAAATASGTGDTVTRDLDAWFRQMSSDDIDIPVRRLATNRDSRTSYSTSQTARLDMTFVQELEQAAQLNSNSSRRASVLSWLESRKRAGWI